MFAGVSDANVSRETFLVQEKENTSRDGLFLRVRIADAARDVQMARRISAKVRITVVAVRLFDAIVSRETVTKFRRTKRETRMIKGTDSPEHRSIRRERQRLEEKVGARDFRALLWLSSPLEIDFNDSVQFVEMSLAKDFAIAASDNLIKPRTRSFAP
jgi:hypothetical protein